MKRIALFAMIAAAALAQDGRPERRGGPGGPGEGRPPMMSPGVQALDADRDGTISAAEMKNASSALRSLDKNRDGSLTEDEVRPQFGPGGRGGPGGPGGQGADSAAMVQRLLAFDRNGDGALAKDEIPERMQGMIARGDLDKDGSLSAAELKTMAESRGPQGAERGRREGGREGRPEGRGPEGGFMRMDLVMSALDADHNGTIDAAELDDAAGALASLDRNRDGRLAGDEIRPAFGRGGPRRDPAEMAGHMMEEWDANGDGKVTAAEMPERMRENFGRFDANRDGFVTKDELQKGFANFGPGGRGRQ
ncbi:MAG: hypothetical protein R2729_25020 [Bryobacteraceae bacterium]